MQKLTQAQMEGYQIDRTPKVQNLTNYNGGKIEWVIFFHRKFPDNKYSKMSQELALISNLKKEQMENPKDMA
jgi:hypothetical protein